MANGHGGARAGAGRKAKQEKYAPQIAETEDLIADHLPWLIGKALERAEGVLVERPTKGPSKRVYKAAPCIKSIAYLVNRILGKPGQEIALVDPDGGPLKIVVCYPEEGPPPEPEADDLAADDDAPEAADDARDTP